MGFNVLKEAGRFPTVGYGGAVLPQKTAPQRKEGMLKSVLNIRVSAG